jgi:protein-disulfide isomerase
LRSCLDSKKTAGVVGDDLVLGHELGVGSTPTVFINGRRVSGFRLYQILALIHESAGERQAYGQH